MRDRSYNLHGWKKSTTNKSFSLLITSNVLSVSAGTRLSGTTTGLTFRTDAETSSSSVSTSANKSSVNKQVVRHVI